MICTVMSQGQFALFMWLLVYNEVKSAQMHNIHRSVGASEIVGTIAHFHLKDNDSIMKKK